VIANVARGVRAILRAVSFGQPWQSTTASRV
jgi:hypothetical protein